ncbi:hypothetical protein BCF33_2704 [Hasllibacter halocynthiae]|uniref:PadR family transcriptional regulator n=1 Tax=Hasllibacter halocynthiae TaxID=595589 RepID=A0A2T0WZ99_9RHOB|nr:hypothetical protein [Hasllibacter halocynthiae]PRY92011.1 hypothetical protein BCF33_2704 [Hasllibacter halocynthiae]
MIAIAFLVAFLLFVLAILVFAIRRADGERHDERRQDPFYAEQARLASAGLIQSREDRRGRQSKRVFLVTPSGEAALRARMAARKGHSDLLGTSFAGVVAPADIVTRARELREFHRARAARFQALRALVEPQQAEFPEAVEAAELGQRFEASCAAFWERQAGPRAE